MMDNPQSQGFEPQNEPTQNQPPRKADGLRMTVQQGGTHYNASAPNPSEDLHSDLWHGPDPYEIGWIGYLFAGIGLGFALGVVFAGLVWHIY